MMSSLPVPVNVWHQQSESDMIVAGRINWIPEQFWMTDDPMLQVDGLWGPHEIRLFPQLWDPRSLYMAWMTLSADSTAVFKLNTILNFMMSKESFATHERD